MVVPNSDESIKSPASTFSRKRQDARRGRIWVVIVPATIIAAMLAWAGLLANKAISIRENLHEAAQLIPQLKQQLVSTDTAGARETVDLLRNQTEAARDTADDPLWTLASGLPLVGENFSAVSEIARSADDVSHLALVPLVDVWGSLDWHKLLPTGSGSNLEPLQAASPSITSAAYAVRVSTERLEAINSSKLLPQIAEPLASARAQLAEITGTLNTAADASVIAPSMLGLDGPKNYLVIIQNNAESRASGGIPGALAVLTVESGRLTLGAQSSASSFGIMSPVLPVEPQQRQIYSGRLGKFIQDVNLTPDFPTAAKLAKGMWEHKTGQTVDGVLSVDPVALSYILNATGPVPITSPELAALAGQGMPTELNGKNVVPTLLSDVYSRIDEPELQDAYFAGVAQEVFNTLARGVSDPQGLIEGISRAAEEGRILVWSAAQDEQALIEQYSLSGAIAGSSVPPAQFGIYFNDGTGAKMDYYIRRTVQLIKECPKDGYEQITVRITSRNTAPLDAATSLPAYVTGNGAFGVPVGSVQTNIVAYGPSQALVESAKVDGNRSDFAPYVHSNRPVGVVAIRIPPGESRAVDFTFSKIVQHSEPNLVVTPTVQPVNDVTLPTEIAQCG